MTLVEVLLASGMLAVGALALASTFLQTASMTGLIEEEAIAMRAIKQKVAEIRDQATRPFADASPFDSVLARYRMPSQQTFAVETLSPPVSGGPSGEVILYLDEGAVPLDLGATPLGTLEVNGTFCGAMDLDGNIVEEDYTGLTEPSTLETLGLLPIEVRVTWQRHGLDQSMRCYILLARTDLPRIEGE